MIRIDTSTSSICEDSVHVTVLGRTLELSLLLDEDQLQPLFSGAAWAGTMIWQAAIELASYTLTEFTAARWQTFRVLELGAGV